MSGSGDDPGGKKALPLFEFGKPRPNERGGIKPLPRRPPPEAAAPEPAPPAAPAPVPLSPPAPPRTPPGALPAPPRATPPLGNSTPLARIAPGGIDAPRPLAHYPPSGGISPIPPPNPTGAGTPGPMIGGRPAYPFEAKPAPEEPSSPYSPEVSGWLQAFMRAVRGRRLYPAGNPVLQSYLEQAYVGLAALLSKVSPVALRVREDRLFFEKDAVLVDPDRMEGLPFQLFSHSIQQIEFTRGMSADELDQLITQLSKDFGSDEHVGEDLVTALWRINLGHFDYLVVDVYNLDVVERSQLDPSAMLMDDETRRLRSELEAIVESLKDPDAVDDGAAGDQVGRLDPLVAAVDLPDESPEANHWDTVALLDEAGLAGIDRDLQRNLRAVDDHDSLLSRLTELLLSALRAEEEGVEGTPGWFLLLALLDAILRGRQFDEAKRLADRLASYLLSQPREEDQALATRLLQHLGSDASVQTILHVLDTTADPAETKAGLALLKHLGPQAYSALVANVGGMTQPKARRLAIELIGSLVAHDRGELLQGMRVATAEVFRDVLGLGEALTPAVASALVWLGAEHLDSGVRARAVALLRGFGQHEADRLVAGFMKDRDPTVRVAAFRAASHRKSQVVLDAFLSALEGKELDRLEAVEINVLLSSLVAVGGNKVTKVVARLLNDAGALGLSRHGAEVRVAAAHALGSIGSPEAKAALQAGSRTLNRKVKQACKVALASKSQGALYLDLPARFGPLSPRPPELDRPPVTDPPPAPPSPTGGHPAPPAARIAGLPISPRPAAPPAAPAAAPAPPAAPATPSPTPLGTPLPAGLYAERVAPPPIVPAEPPPLLGFTDAYETDTELAEPEPSVLSAPSEPTAPELPIESLIERTSTHREMPVDAPPPLLDPSALRFASEVTSPEPVSDIEATMPDMSADLAQSVLEAETVREEATSASAPPAPTPEVIVPPPRGLTDDLSLDLEAPPRLPPPRAAPPADAPEAPPPRMPPPREAPPRLPSSALNELIVEEPEDGGES